MKELLEFLEKRNKENQEWMDASPGRWCSMYCVEEKYWRDKGITKMEDFHRWSNEGFYSDYHKSLYGFRPRDVNYETITNAELQAKCDELIEAGKRQAEWDAIEKAKDDKIANRLMKELNVDRDTLKRWKVM